MRRAPGFEPAQGRKQELDQCLYFEASRGTTAEPTTASPRIHLAQVTQGLSCLAFNVSSFQTFCGQYTYCIVYTNYTCFGESNTEVTQIYCPLFPSDAASVVSVRPGGSLTGQYGGEVELQCEGTGSPTPSMSWQQTSARGVAGRYF